MHYGGETVYRSDHMGTRTKLSVAPELKRFLDGDSRIYTEKENLVKRLSYLRSVRNSFEANCRRSKEILTATLGLINYQSSTIIHEANKEKHVLEAELDELLGDRDSMIMKVVHKYFAVLAAEKNIYARQMTEDAEFFRKKRWHFFVDRDMQIFAASVSSETMGCVELSILARDSEQYQRCKKAVKDNTASNIFNHEKFEGIKVLNVVNVKHSVLSKKLAQCAKQRDERGKVKGLFCSLTSEDVHSFLAYGLYRQKKLSYGCDGELEVFKRAWYSYPLPQRYKKQSEASLQSSSKSSAAAALAGGQRAHAPLHFSRKIYLPNLTTRALEDTHSKISTQKSSDHELDMPYLALCRVLLYKTYEVKGSITDADVDFAMGSDYDSVHSADCDDFVLLNPNCVIPEFIMHVQLQWTSEHIFSPCLIDEEVSSQCHPACLIPSDTSALIFSHCNRSSDVVTRDSIIYDEGSCKLGLPKILRSSAKPTSLIQFLKSNEEHNRSRYCKDFENEKSAGGPSKNAISAAAVGNEKYELLNDLEHIINSTEKHVKYIVKGHADRLRLV